ncbi:DUF4352 domain-containing protein [Alkalicoccus urumqiensis]|uniref:DUF4352 domain-containing protein n=1 Tax=Alkalicoccus urumqiensis TaxID=1548213 RepID=A0A2P6MFI6_ALKUR|nr:DUF4352 domain-containing protein [Alkalicoccus urumqiensis]PRO65055.1 DUF4352 domain-containing protein [Alkalicoccus urumqiensis]
MKKLLKWGLYAFLGLIALAVVAAIVGDEETQETAEDTSAAEETVEDSNSNLEEPEESAESDNTTSPDENSENTNEGTNNAEESNAVESVGVGEPAEINDVAFTVNSVEEAEELGGGEFMDPATTSGKFVILDVTVSNDRDEALTIDSSFFKLYSSEGAEYEPARSGEVIMAMTDEDDFFLEQVNPGLEKSGKVVFETGADVDVESSIMQGQTGFWGTETVEINLQ